MALDHGRIEAEKLIENAQTWVDDVDAQCAAIYAVTRPLSFPVIRPLPLPLHPLLRSTPLKVPYMCPGRLNPRRGILPLVNVPKANWGMSKPPYTVLRPGTSARGDAPTSEPGNTSFVSNSRASL